MHSSKPATFRNDFSNRVTLNSRQRRLSASGDPNGLRAFFSVLGFPTAKGTTRVHHKTIANCFPPQQHPKPHLVAIGQGQFDRPNRRTFSRLANIGNDDRPLFGFTAGTSNRTKL